MPSPPQPTPSPLPPGPGGPALWNLLRYVLRPDTFFARAQARFGACFSVDLAGLGRFVFLGDPAAIRDVFHGDPEVLRTGEANLFAVDALGPGSLLTLDGDAHARQRRALSPPLHGERLEAHTPVLRDLTHAEIDRWRPGVPVRLEDACREITLQAILRVIFGMREGPQLDELAELIRRVMEQYAHPLAFAVPFLPRALVRSAGRRVEQLQAAIDGALRRLIQEHRAAGSDNASVLAKLLTMRHEDGAPLGDGELRDHLFTMLLAGHDTTAIALGWALAEILPRPALVAALEAELRDVTASSGQVAFEHLERLRLLDAAIKESLRLRPLVDFSVRLLRAPFSTGGVTYPAGITLAPCMLLAHRNPAVWPAPDEFRPERFLEGRPDPYAFIPFGGGVRRCIGMAFALFEMHVVLATILGRVRFAPRRGRAPRMQRRGLFLAPSDRATFVPSSITDRGAGLQRFASGLVSSSR